MRINLNKKQLFSLLLVPALFSCIRESCSSCNQDKSYNEQFRVSFCGNYAITKSASAFPAGVETSVFAYYCGEDPALKNEHPTTPISTISDMSGNLQFRNGSAFYLSPGYYDFYALSTNSSSLNGFTCKKGKSDTLENGVDYLWAQKRDITICNHSKIEFNFKHAAASIIIEVNTTLASNQINLSKALIGVPKRGQTLALANGEITPAKSIENTKAQMFINSNTACYIILPLEKEIEIPVQLDIENTSSSNLKSQKTYYFKLPAPPNGFQGGMQYRFRATISLRKVILWNASVEPWEENKIDNIYLNETI